MFKISDTVEVCVSPFLEGDELIIDISVGDKDLTPVRVPIVDLIDEYIDYHSEMFQSVISTGNAPDAKRLVGILRLAAHTLETAIV